MADEAQTGPPLDAIVRGLDHDLRNPVANILGFADLIRVADGGALTRDQQEFLRRIEHNCHALLTMLEELAATAKRMR